MSVSLDDLSWCIDQVMPANPAYLMALPTRIDPMLGYLTTGYLDHVRIRDKFGYRVNEPMWEFFKRLGIVTADGQPGANFGDPGHVYLQFCRARGDTRDEAEIRAEASEQIEAVRARGVFIAENHGARPWDLEPDLERHVQAITDEARACIWEEFDAPFLDAWPDTLKLHTRSADREDYILHPGSGEKLSAASALQLAEWETATGDYDTVIVMSDGLNVRALKQLDQLSVLVHMLRDELVTHGFKVAPSEILVHAGRVRAGYRIGEQIFSGKKGACRVLHIVGERPGTGQNTLSIYMTRADAAVWAQSGTVDHNITRVVSGIARTALQPEQAAQEAVAILAG